MKERTSWHAQFQQTSEIISEWREEHPKAKFNDIENCVDEQLAKIRVQMIQDLALESALTDFKQLPAEERPKCPGCGRVMAANGKQKRRIITKHERVVELKRSKGYCSNCRVSFFPPG